MRLLLDECVPRPLKRDLAEHDVHHVVDMGWSSKRNGELLQLIVEARFEALLTVDRGIEFLVTSWVTSIRLIPRASGGRETDSPHVQRMRLLLGPLYRG